MTSPLDRIDVEGLKAAAERETPGEWSAVADDLIDALSDERDYTLLLRALITKAREYVCDAVDAHRHSDGEELLAEIDAAMSDQHQSAWRWTDIVNPSAVLALIGLLRATENERDYAVAEMKNAQAYWRAETHHAEQAEASNAELIAQRAALVEALTVLKDRASTFSISGVYFDEPSFDDNVAALKLADAALSKALGQDGESAS